MAVSPSDGSHAATIESPSSSLHGGPVDGRLTNQQQQWLADLYQTHFAAVFRLCNRILRSADDAADAAHETFLVALDSMQSEVPPKVARSWLLTVARNHCLDLLRRRKRYGRALVILGGNPHNGADIEAPIVERDFVDRVLSQLPLRERQALWQSAVESRPLADIAMGLRLNYMAAAQVLHRARQHAAGTAARIAVVIGIVRLARVLRRRLAQGNTIAANQSGYGSLLSADKILTLAAVPLIAAAIQSSSSAVAPPASASQVIPQTTVVSRTGVVGTNPLLPSPGSLRVVNDARNGELPDATRVPVSVWSAVDALLENVNHSIGPPTATQPSPAVPSPPVPTPSLPPVP
jgi:RNA polymerase sigma-70 factor, ECF subfamily